MIRILLILATVVQTIAANPKLPTCELTDQFGATHRIASPTERPLLITIADRKGAAAMDIWIPALKSRYGDAVIYIGIADVSSTPAPMRGYVKAQFKKKYNRPVLLDWDGKISRQLSAKPRVPNIYLFASTGELIASKHKPHSESAAAELPTLPGPRAPSATQDLSAEKCR